MKQKDVFLQGEGDAWFARNADSLAHLNLRQDDQFVQEIVRLREQLPASVSVRALEVGCGPGTRLAWLKNELDFECHGLEPSAKAAEFAAGRGLDVRLGTADHLPWDSDSFDVVTDEPQEWVATSVLRKGHWP